MLLFKPPNQTSTAPGFWFRLVRRVRRRVQSRSVLMLLLFGFLLVAAPLAIGLIISGHQVDRLSRTSEQLLQQSIDVGQAARVLTERIVALERSARQYRVLGDAEALAALGQQRESFRDGIFELNEVSSSSDLRTILNEMTSQETDLIRRLYAVQSEQEWPSALAREFDELRQLANAVNTAVNRAAAAAVDRLEQLGRQARTTSMVQLALIFAFAVVLAIVFARMINRPIRQLDQGIRQLARPNAEAIPQVNSPRDLRALSLRLESVRRRLLRVEKDRQRLLGQASHELKTPLSALSEGVSLLKDELLGPLGTPQAEVIEIMQQSVRQLQSQIDTLLSYNRIRTQMERRAHRVIAVEALVQAALDGQRLSIKARKLNVQVTVESAMQIKGDRDLLLTALDNLLSNAIKYSPIGSRVGLFARSEREWLVIDVADQGPGIAIQERPLIFDPFFRGSQDDRAEVAGTGLGLVICRDLIRANGGEVHLHQAATSESSEWTTIFRMTIPLWRVEQTA